jgi:P pilus assembly chaperone PapD
MKGAKFMHFTVRNTQNKPVSVEIENRYYVMKEDGSMEYAQTAGRDGLRKILFTPNSFILNPGEKQVVRFFIKDKSLAKEMRSYAYILTNITTDPDKGSQKDMTSMSLSPKVAIVIPIIYRPETKKDNVLIKDLTFSQVESECLIKISWINSFHSSYLNFEAFDKQNEKVYEINGVSNFLPSFFWSFKVGMNICKKLKRIKIFDVDNDVYVFDREISL